MPDTDEPEKLISGRKTYFALVLSLAEVNRLSVALDKRTRNIGLQRTTMFQE